MPNHTHNANHICPTCGRQFSPNLGVQYNNHVKSCAKRPSRDELDQLLATHTYGDLAQKLHVGTHTIAKWVKGYGINGRDRKYRYVVCPVCGRRGKAGKKMQLHIAVCESKPSDAELYAIIKSGGNVGHIAAYYEVVMDVARSWTELLPGVPELAPKYGRKGNCLGRLGKNRCPAYDKCARFVQRGGWCLCEAPRPYDAARAIIDGIFEPPAGFGAEWLPELETA